MMVVVARNMRFRNHSYVTLTFHCLVNVLVNLRQDWGGHPSYTIISDSQEELLQKNCWLLLLLFLFFCCTIQNVPHFMMQHCEISDTKNTERQRLICLSTAVTKRVDSKVHWGQIGGFSHLMFFSEGTLLSSHSALSHVSQSRRVIPDGALHRLTPCSLEAHCSQPSFSLPSSLWSLFLTCTTSCWTFPQTQTIMWSSWAERLLINMQQKMSLMLILYIKRWRADIGKQAEFAVQRMLTCRRRTE